ncbi:MAG: hypothetical protein DRJ18_02125 [Candidatus Methanomethylicota archaeon]|nr:hypothetical protein [Candidatus Culexmicrobium cathedralense]RLE48395.1 MAG: hypothetical protein DRJ18_02125 [Candidatus Verstraetearchaeota archaeon]
MKTYIKIYGPPILEALKALEKAAVEISKEFPEVTFYDFLGGTAIPLADYAAETLNIPVDEAQVRVEKLISKSGWTLGDFDFYFEWARPPTFEELQKLIAKIDEALKPLGCYYTITTK